MKILMIDKYHFIKGGAERYLFELAGILESYGHEVFHFSMKDERNFPTIYENYFVDNIDYNSPSTRARLLKSFKYVPKLFYSREAREKIEKFIRKIRPDVAHLHMIDHQISPSILHSLKKYKIPVLQTVHQYKLVCPNYLLYNTRVQRICEKCVRGRYFHAVLSRCHKGSFLASSIVCLETYFHKSLKIYENNIDLFHVPSKFIGKKLMEARINREKIRHAFYTLNLDDYDFNPGFQDYFVYFGRLYIEKGVLTLLKAMKNIRLSKLVIVGDGPQRKFLQEFVKGNNINNVEFVGEMGGQVLKETVSNAMFVVVPSEWYDNSPLVIYESFAMGKPVIGSRIGGIPELIDHSENGLLFESGNASDLAEKINYLINNPQVVKLFGESARAKAERFFSHKEHYVKILQFYEEIANG